MQKIFVVFERDCGNGPTMLRAFASYEEAVHYMREHGSYIEEVEFKN